VVDNFIDRSSNLIEIETISPKFQVVIPQRVREATIWSQDEHFSGKPNVRFTAKFT